jgi:hypothetical protein
MLSSTLVFTMGVDEQCEQEGRGMERAFPEGFTGEQRGRGIAQPQCRNAGIAASACRADSVSVHVSLRGQNGEAMIAPLASGGVILVNQGSSTTTFPSWGIYRYGPNGGCANGKVDTREKESRIWQKPLVPIR